MTPDPNAPRRRRALSHVGGPADLEGHPADARALAHALDVPPSTDADDDPSRQHVHGFHTYPARLHPDTAGRLVRAFVPDGGRVLDPFCGSGTVLVEALVAGRRPIGTDLNPLAVMLAAVKTRPRAEAEVDHLIRRAYEVANHADERRLAKAGATRRFPFEDTDLFEPHVLLELDSLRDGIETLPDEPARLDLLMVLSACLVKLSKKRGDTTDRVVGRRTAGGFPARYFVLKAEELARRFGEFARLLGSPLPPPAGVTEDDATDLRSVRGTVDGIVTSPPYAATYDYVAHHALRLRWLGLDAANLARNELGSRSTYQEVDPREAREVWGWELSRFLKAAARVLVPGGPLVMVIGDTAVSGVPLHADRIVAEVAPRCGFAAAARASQPRPHFHNPSVVAFKYRVRHEHALLLRRA